MRPAVLVALLVAACDRTPARAPADAGRPPPPPPPQPIDAMGVDAAPRIAWVDPARCVTPCAREPALVELDGGHRVDASVVEPLGRLIAAAKDAGYTLRVESAYRSYDEQVEVFRTTKQVGRAARPGHSEHQLGTAVDLDLPTKGAIAWLAAHATDFGFVVSYPPGKHRVTGYRPEPWHVRYVGDELAATLKASGGTLEELLRSRPELGAAGTCADCPSALSRAPCGDVPVEGRCAGDVLEWCYDGALAAVHCGTLHARCGELDGQRDCVP